VGEEDEVSIREVAHMINRAMGMTVDIKFDSSQSDGQFKKTASNAKLRRYLPHFQFTPFQQAIEESVEWFCQNFDTARK
jgi:GDP-L-fucose synthase